MATASGIRTVRPTCSNSVSHPTLANTMAGEALMTHVSAIGLALRDHLIGIVFGRATHQTALAP